MNQLLVIHGHELSLCRELDDISSQHDSVMEHTWTIRWQTTVAKYSSDLHTYIWQPHQSPPPFASAQMFVTKDKNACPPKTLILFSTSRSLKLFREEYELSNRIYSRLKPPAIALLHVICTIFSVAIGETKYFLHDTSRQIFDLVRQLHNSLLHAYSTDQDLQESGAPRQGEKSTPIVPS